VDSNPTRRRRKEARYAAQAQALDALARAQRKLRAAQLAAEEAERDRDDALVAAKAAGCRAPELCALLGVGRHTVLRRVAAAQETAA
jgi:hypothetical protein